MRASQIARQYRELAVKGATPVGLILLLYDMAIESLARAAHEIDAGNIEGRTIELNHVLAIVGELQRSLNFERGGDTAKRLTDFYDVTRNKILEANIKSSKEPIERLSHIFCSLREAWQVVERDVAGQPGERAPAKVAATSPSTKPAPSSEPESEPARLQWSA